MFKRKKWLLLLIILFPSAFWLILETSSINSKKLPFYGPKKAHGKDTLYYSLGNISFFDKNDRPVQFDTVSYPIMAVTFIKPNYAGEGYRLKGMTDYTQYKKNELDKIPFVFVCPKNDQQNFLTNVRDTLEIDMPNIEQAYWSTLSFDSLNLSYFKEKPYYIDYSFIVLLDKHRRIRGYYDGRYVAELKRLIAEYKHLRLKEEKNELIKENEIKVGTNN